MRSAQALDRQLRAPPGFEQVVNAPRGVTAIERGVVTAPGPPGHGEDENLLGSLHERGGLGQVGGRGPALQGEPLTGRINDLQYAPGPPGDFGDGLVAEVV